MNSLPMLTLGLLLGMLHATDADHLVAVSTLVTREHGVRGAARIGALWGVGHATTLIAAGCAVIVFNLAIPVRFELAAEFCVALMLMLLGASSLAPRHGHAHAGTPPAEAGAGRLGRRAGPCGWQAVRQLRSLRPLGIGIVHGLAGSAAVVLLVLAQTRDAWWGVAYLLLFVLGTAAGMLIVTSAFALPLLHTRRRPRLDAGIRIAASVSSVGLGGYLAWSVGVGGGLLVAAGLR